MVLRNDCHVGLMHVSHPLYASRSFLQSADMPMQSMSDIMHVSYISRKDEKVDVGAQDYYAKPLQ